MRTQSHSSRRYGAFIIIAMALTSCRVPEALRRVESKAVPAKYDNVQDTVNSANRNWRDFFNDDSLAALIDTALRNNQELNILTQEISIARNDVNARKGEYLPFVSLGAGVGAEKVGRYTSQGANDANTDIMPGKEFPEPLPDVALGAVASWEIDIWKKLRNAKKSAVLRYLSTNDARDFMVTNLVAEIAETYYELLALDNQIKILEQNIRIQTDALSIMKQEKEAAKVTEMAVKKFEAEVFKNRSLMFDISQQVTEKENRIHFLTGRFQGAVKRDPEKFLVSSGDTVFAGTPAQLLRNRPDIRQAEKELAAAKLDVKIARAMFYPSLHIDGAVGFRAYDPQLVFSLPASLIYSIAGELAAPLLNRKAISAAYSTASNKKLQRVYNYERTVLNAFLEASNNISKTRNLRRSYELKSRQVEALNKCVGISAVLFRSARADYMEVLMTQRDALDSRFELVETKMLQMKARIGLYRSLGGGWR